MGGESPNVVLFDINGNQMAVQNGVAIPGSTPALLLAGSDGTNSRFLTVDTSGRAVLTGAGVAGTPAGGVISIQGVVGGTVLPVQVITTSSTATTTVAASATNVTLLATNSGRRGATIWNDSTTATLYVKLGTTASNTSYAAQLFPTGYYEVPYSYTGEIDGIWTAAVGNARITELT